MTTVGLYYLLKAVWDTGDDTIRGALLGLCGAILWWGIRSWRR